MLDDRQIAVFREKLLEQKTALLDLKETGQDAARTVELDQSRVGRLSRMDAMQAQAMSRETGRRRRAKLRQVDAALQRITDGTFGSCHECGEPISDGRLRFDPTVLLCIDCASAMDS